MKRGGQRRNVRIEKRERQNRAEARHKAEVRAKRAQSETTVLAWGCRLPSGETYEEWFDVDLT